MTDPRYTLRLTSAEFNPRSVAWCRPPTKEHPKDGKLARLVPDAASALDGIADLLAVDSCFRPPDASRREYLTDPGPADGVLGRRTRAALAAFRREWVLPAAGGVDARVLRCLVAATARVEDVT